MSTINTIFYGVRGKVRYEPPRLIVKLMDGKQYYWNFQQQCWKRLTRRCPYLM